jgi:hypothetical protein
MQVGTEAQELVGRARLEEDGGSEDRAKHQARDDRASLQLDGSPRSSGDADAPEEDAFNSHGRITGTARK